MHKKWSVKVYDSKQKQLLAYRNKLSNVKQGCLR